MKVLQISRGLNPTYVLRLYRNSVLSYIKYYNDTKAMQSLHSMFSDRDFDLAISQIYIDGDYICIASSNRLLRFLEYGGPTVKALRILSKAYTGLYGGML